MSLVPRPTPTFSAPSALEYFDALVADDEQFPLLEAAIAAIRHRPRPAGYACG